MTPARCAAAVAILGLFWTPAAPGSLVKVELVVEGETVTATTKAQLGFFPLHTTQVEPALTCPFGRVCSVPAGIFTMDIVSDDVMLIRRPKMHSDPPEEGERVHHLRLEAVRSAWVVADLPKQNNYRLDLVDISTGAVFHRIFDPKRTRLKAPARALIGALRDGSRHLGLFRLTPKAGEVIPLEAPASPSRGRGQLLCSFVFPEASQGAGYSGLLPTLSVGTTEVSPDVLIVGDHWHVWAIWFGAAAGPFQVTTHDPLWVPSTPIHGEIPDRGTLSLQRLAMIPKPSLSSTLRTGERLSVSPVEMQLFDCSALAPAGWPLRLNACTAVATAAGKTGSPVLFEHLTPSYFALQWRTSQFGGIHVIDMRDGKSRTDAFAPDILRVSGQVRRGEKPLSTTVRFVDGVTETAYETTSDEDGHYEVFVCPRSAYVVAARIEGRAAFTKSLDIIKDVVYDIVVPRNAIAVFVGDRDTGSAVPNASVTFTLSGGKQSTGGVITSDENGMAKLAPLQSGALTYTATAKGYEKSADQRTDVNESMEATLTVLLKASPSRTMQIREADGVTPAIGAIVSWRDGQSAGPASDGGVVNLDEAIGDGTGIAVVNSRGEVSVFRWQDAGDNVFNMQPAGPRVSLRFENAGKPMPYQLPRYSLDGITIPHPLDMQARLKGGGDPNSRRDGTMIIPGLPASGLLTLWPALHPEFAVTVSLPMGEIVRLQAVKYPKGP